MQCFCYTPNLSSFSAQTCLMILSRLLRPTRASLTLRSHLNPPPSRLMASTTNGDLNNTGAARISARISADPMYRHASFAISPSEDDALVRQTYRPFLLEDVHSNQDWIAGLELSTALAMVDSQVLKSGAERVKVLVLYGSMRNRYGSCVSKPLFRPD